MSNDRPNNPPPGAPTTTETSVARRVGPPPPPPGAMRPSNPGAPPQQPADGAPTGSLLQIPSTKEKIDIASTALRLRSEQVEAKVIYFGAEQQTNKELDAITEAVIAELKSLQLAGVRPATQDRSEAEIELIGNLRALLEKLFSSRRETFLRRKLEDIQRRITTLFFNSALYSKLSADSEERMVMDWPDQAVFFVLRENKAQLQEALKGLQYTELSVLRESLDRLESIEKDLRREYLSRTTPELEKLLEVYRTVLVQFLLTDFRNTLGEFAWEVIRESRVGQGKLSGYKLNADGFGPFRESFERHFLERLVLNVQEPIMRRAGELREVFRGETIKFVSDPRVFLEICSVICDSIYDYLYGEGFLDLPAQWRAHLLRAQ